MHSLARLLRPSLLAALALGVGLFATPREAAAFCGFYVAGADAKLFNNATVVVLMRDGTRTVLSMQNEYEGPPEKFALVIPVPVVLQEADVKTLRKELFARVDKLAAPRLVEYWESDPCAPEDESGGFGGLGLIGTGVGGGGTGQRGIGLGTVKIEAQFEVEEYEIVILSATESTGLDAWLRDNGYNIPSGAEPLLRPYVQADMKFFVAKVDPTKVKFGENGKTMLSPLRFHYDSKDFVLPVRLGLINAPDPASGGKQDLLVHILAPESRYQMANYPNVTIPTNLDLREHAASRFGEFYVSLFDHTLAQHPNAVVTEYSWVARNCDPCPDTPLSAKELLELGADVLPKWSTKLAAEREAPGGGFGGSGGSEFVLTRLHARYDATSLGEDLVFEAAPAITGGREWPRNAKGELEEGATPTEGDNNFQARYAIRHEWAGEIACKDPVRGRWGGPPKPEEGVMGNLDQPPGRPAVARGLTSVSRDSPLGSFVTAGAGAQLGVTVLASPEPAAEPEAKAEAASKPEPRTDVAARPEPAGCACTAEGRPIESLAASLGLLALFGLRRRSTH